MQIRSDSPAERFRPNPGAIMHSEKYLVCRRNGSQEIISQSEDNADRAQHSVDVLNEHEERNAREPGYYWRLKRSDE